MPTPRDRLANEIAAVELQQVWIKAQIVEGNGTPALLRYAEESVHELSRMRERLELMQSASARAKAKKSTP